MNDRRSYWGRVFDAYVHRTGPDEPATDFRADEILGRRSEIEWQLIKLIDRFSEVLGAAYAERHPEPGDLFLWDAWAQTIGILSKQERDVFAEALHVCNAILHRRFRIVLDDIRMHIAKLEGVISSLVERIADLDDGDYSNVIRLRNT